MPTPSGLREGERGGLGAGIERDVGARRVVVDGDGRERRVDGVERQPRGGRAHLDVDDFHARHSASAHDVGLELDRIVDGNDVFGNFPGVLSKEKTGSAPSDAG